MVELPYLTSPDCQVEDVEQTGSILRITARTNSTESRCPICATPSSSIHSYHLRQLKDLPMGEQAVLLTIRTKRFRCRNPDCPKVTFVEEIPGVLVKNARRTPRLSTALWHIGQVAGGQAGARLTRHLHMQTSRSSLLRILRQRPQSHQEAASVIGIDDWAKRKGQRYGTLVVDLERHRVVELLEDRESATLAAWLRTQPQVHTVARDRSMQYALGISEGAPHAVQVADRWHLLKNLSETVERVLQDLLPKMKRQILSAYDKAPREQFPRAEADLARQAASRARRLGEYTLVNYLRQQGYAERRIARLLGMSRGKVRSFYRAETFPERKHHYVPSMLDPYLPYLQQRVSEGCLNAQQLWHEIGERGYRGSSSQVSKWMTDRRRGARQQPPIHLPPASALSLPGLRTCVRLMTTAHERLSPEDMVLLEYIRQEKLLDILYQLVQRFMTMVRQQQATLLDDWLVDCRKSDVAALQHFAASLAQDYAAVHAALELPWSNGQTEGQVHRLKLLKRQMYGRANLDLLRLRILYSP
jgi:transposase